MAFGSHITCNMITLCCSPTVCKNENLTLVQTSDYHFNSFHDRTFLPQKKITSASASALVKIDLLTFGSDV